MQMKIRPAKYGQALRLLHYKQRHQKNSILWGKMLNHLKTSGISGRALFLVSLVIKAWLFQN
jgi:hypothetical protein